MYRTSVLLIALVGTWCVVMPLGATAAEPEKRTVTVSAMAEVNVVPDQVVFTLGITTEDAKALAAAKIANDGRTRAVLGVIGKHGVPAKGIQISEMHMGPRYSRDGVLRHYYVTREIEVVLTDFGAVDRIIDGTMAAGANHVGDLLFRSTKNREMQVEARRKAVEYAKEKASHLAQLNGLKLGKALTIEENVEAKRETTGYGGAMASVSLSASLGTPKPWADIHLTADTPNVAGDVPPTAEGANQGPVLAPGIIVIDATVRITFEMVE